MVNRAISPDVSKADYEMIQSWVINPRSGNCNDYAVSKRHELLRLGLPASALILATVRTPSGEAHLILVVRTQRGDMVLDNLHDEIRAWNQTGYRLVMRQAAESPAVWIS